MNLRDLATATTFVAIGALASISAVVVRCGTLEAACICLVGMVYGTLALGVSEWYVSIYYALHGSAVPKRRRPSTYRGWGSEKRVSDFLEAAVEKSVQWSLVLHVVVCAAYYLSKSREFGPAHIIQMILHGLIPTFAMSALVRVRTRRCFEDA